MLYVAASGTGNISLVEGKMDSIKYQKILGANITPSVKKAEDEKRRLLQQDNDPKHTSKSAMVYLKKHKLKVLP